MANRLLLFSNSRMAGMGFLEHALPALGEFLHGAGRLVFAPYAGHDHDAYLAAVRAALAPLGVEVEGLHRAPDPRAALETAGALFVGGGNSFRLVRALHELGLLAVVRRRVAAGELRYVGASAGTNAACPTIRTTNDMPVVAPPSLEAFGLLPFQVNPHYLDADPGSTHMGETRAMRLLEFLEENDVAVVGLREGAWLRREGERLALEGANGARLFRRGRDPQELAPGADLSFLLALPAEFDRPV